MVVMKNDVAAYLGTQATAGVVFAAVFGMIWLNFVLEIVVNVLVAPALHRVVCRVEKAAGGRRRSAVGPESEKEKAFRGKSPAERKGKE